MDAHPPTTATEILIEVLIQRELPLWTIPLTTMAVIVLARIHQALLVLIQNLLDAVTVITAMTNSSDVKTSLIYYVKPMPIANHYNPKVAWLTSKSCPHNTISSHLVQTSPTKRSTNSNVTLRQSSSISMSKVLPVGCRSLTQSDESLILSYIPRSGLDQVSHQAKLQRRPMRPTCNESRMTNFSEFSLLYDHPVVPLETVLSLSKPSLVHYSEDLTMYSSYTLLMLVNLLV